MLLTIHNQHLKKVAFIDNNKQKTLNYYDDTWTRQLETGSSTFEFTVFKRSVQSDMLGYKAYKTLHDKAFISFKYKQQTYVFNVMRVEEDEHTIKCYCENLNLELLNEYSNPYKAKEAMSFKQYCDILGLLNYSALSIGINEVADFKRTLEWEGQDTKLARLLSLANKFDAEIEFETKLNPDSTLKSFKINVYRENDDEHQGVGRIRTDIRLEYKKNLKSIKRTVDKTGIFNAVRPTGKTEGDDPKEVTIGGMVDPIKEKNAKGILEFYQDGDVLYAPISRQMYPSAFAPENNDDQWIRKDLFVESDNQKVIRAAGLRALKKAAYPAVTYEIDGFLDVEIGDTIQIYDNGFSPALNIRARVSEQTISFTNPQNNKTTFANFKELENRLSSNLQARLEQLIDESRPYSIRLSSSNGVAFKNNTGTSIITPVLLKGSKELSDVVWKWQLGNMAITTGNTYTANGSLITDVVTLTVMACLNNKEVARNSISLVNVNDGARGEKGEPGDVNTVTIKGRSLITAFEDVEGKVNSKADQAITQDQLNKLAERDAQLKAEMDTKAAADLVDKWINEIKNLAAVDEAGRKEAEAAAIRASERIVDLQRKVGELKIMTEFVDTYMSQSEEGLIVGRKDGSSKVLVSNDRISFISGGKEVASISQGVLQIDNGVFVKSLRIGRFVTIQDPTNPNRNLTLYVGGA